MRSLIMSSNLVYLSLSVFYHEFHLHASHPSSIVAVTFGLSKLPSHGFSAIRTCLQSWSVLVCFVREGARFLFFHDCITVYVYIQSIDESSLSLIRVYFMWFTSHYGMGRNIMPEMFGTVIHVVWELKEKPVDICTLCSVDNSWTWGFYCFSFLLFMISLQLQSHEQTLVLHNYQALK